MPSRQAVFAAQDFLRAYESRSRERRLREDVDECVERFLANPRSPGLNFEKLSESDGIEVSSCRINVQYRLIVANDRRRFVLLYFDNHDEAYDWATRARKRIPRIVGSARTWTGANAVVQSPTPHLDEDVPVPVESIAALGEMLANGMYAYIAHLDEVQRSYATSDFQRRNGSMFVRGGAGTGKTAIAIHRIAHLSAQQEIGRLGVLYLCFNNVLLKTVTEALRGLFGGSIPATIEARTFHAWAYAYLKDHAAEPKICQDNSVLNGDVGKAIEDEGLAMALGNLGVPGVVSEIRNVIKPSGVATLDEYLQLERHKAGTPLQRLQRQVIWQVYERVHHAAGGRIYQEDLPGLAVKKLVDDGKFIGYRAVVIDEAQDCTRPMAQLAVALVKGDHRRITVFADPTQSVYPSGFYWARQEIAPRGSQNVVLRTPYRSTRQIHACAASLFANVDDVEREVIDLGPAERDGPSPVIHVEQNRAGAEQSLIDAVKQELADSRAPRELREIGVLVYRNSERDELCKLLSANGIAAEAVDASNVWLDRQTVKVMTVHAAKGLDFPSIYLYRFMAERTEPSEQRALMYVALTRSSFRLTVMCDRSTVSPLLEDLEPSTYRLTGTARGVLWS